MPRRLSSAVDIVRNSRGWTVLIQVIERGNVQTSRTMPPKRMKRFLFTDSQGTKVSAGVNRALFSNENQPEIALSTVEPASSAATKIPADHSPATATEASESSKKDAEESPSKKAKGNL